MPLVIFFVPEPAKGVAEMARVVRPGGIVAAYAWDMLGGGFPYAAFREEMRALGLPVPLPPSPDASRLEGCAICGGAGLEASRDARDHRAADVRRLRRLLDDDPRRPERRRLAAMTSDDHARLKLECSHACQRIRRGITYGACANAIGVAGPNLTSGANDYREVLRDRRSALGARDRASMERRAAAAGGPARGRIGRVHWGAPCWLRGAAAIPARSRPRDAGDKRSRTQGVRLPPRRRDRRRPRPGRVPGGARRRLFNPPRQPARNGATRPTRCRVHRWAHRFLSASHRRVGRPRGQQRARVCRGPRPVSVTDFGVGRPLVATTTSSPSAFATR